MDTVQSPITPPPVLHSELIDPVELQRVDCRQDDFHTLRSVYPSGGQPFLVTDPDGGRWVYKRINPQQLQAEVLGALGCALLGVRAPIGATISGRCVWLSGYIDKARPWNSGITIPSNIKDLGGMLALDAVLMNDDRHCDNLLVVGGADGRTSAVPIDWDACEVTNLAPDPDAITRPVQGWHHRQCNLPLDLCHDAALVAAAQLQDRASQLARVWSAEAARASNQPHVEPLLRRNLELRLRSARMHTDVFLTVLEAK